MPPNEPWWVGYLVEFLGIGISFLGIVLAAGLVVWQMNRQHRSALLLQRVNAKEEHKLRIFQTLEEGISTAQAPIAEAISWATVTPLALRSRVLLRKNLQRPPAPVSQRAQQFSSLNGGVSKGIAHVQQLIEHHEIALPRFRIFHMAFTVQLAKVDKEFWLYYAQLQHFLPVNKPAHIDDPSLPAVLTARDASVEDVEQLRSLALGYIGGLVVLESYLHDLAVAIQNALLVSLFEREVPRRRPSDPEMKVITTDAESIRALEAAFLSEEPYVGRDLGGDLPSNYL